MLEFNAEEAKKLTEYYKMTHYGDELQKIFDQIREATSKGLSCTYITIENNNYFWIANKLKNLGYNVTMTAVSKKLEISWG